jgi:hypothetical protein
MKSSSCSFFEVDFPRLFMAVISDIACIITNSN